MKKNVVFPILILVMFLFTACVNENKQVIEEVESEEENVLEEVENEIIEEKDYINEEINEYIVVEVDDEIEKSEPMYILNNDSTVKPIDETADNKVVLLTIDDAPEHYAVDMAKLLKAKGVNAIFFVNGHFIKNEVGKEKLRTIYDLGFEIGNHTMNHPNLRELSEEAQREEIVALNDLVEEIIGERPRFFRAPYGANTDYARELVKEEGMLLMNWTYGYDYFKPYMNAEALTEAMITGKGPEVGVPHSLLRPGANLLMHDREWTLEALPDIISGLREKGYEFADPKLIKGIES